jgi:hypothetical protein
MALTWELQQLLINQTHAFQDQQSTPGLQKIYSSSGVGYGQVLEQYGDTGRVRAWTRIAPDRVTPKIK